jgi:hypothetical protein
MTDPPEPDEATLQRLHLQAALSGFAALLDYAPGYTVRCWANGSRGWLRNGVHHRLLGPAIEAPDGAHQYWVDGQRVSRESWARLAQQRVTNDSSSGEGDPSESICDS